MWVASVRVFCGSWRLCTKVQRVAHIAARELMPKASGGEDAKTLGRRFTEAVRRDAYLLAEVVPRNSEDSSLSTLDADAFLAVQPSALRKAFDPGAFEALFRVFANDGGELDRYGLFRLSLARATHCHGSASLRAAFMAHDWNSCGELNSLEFGAACTAFGFGPAAADIFYSVDADGSGTVSTDELVAHFSLLPPSSLAEDMAERRQVEALFDAYDAAVEAELLALPSVIDIDDWQLRASDAASLRAELCARLAASGAASALALVGRLSEDWAQQVRQGFRDFAINSVAFSRAMRQLGYHGPAFVLDQIFDELDVNRVSAVGLFELWALLSDGKRHPLGACVLDVC